MKLDLALLGEALSETFELTGAFLCNDTRFLNRVMLYTGEPMDEEGAVYVADGPALPEEPSIDGACAVVCVGPPPARYRSGVCNSLVLDSAETARVLNALQGVFYRHQMYHDRLHRTLYLEKGIHAVMEEALLMLENPVYIHDKNFRIIAYAEDWTLSGMDERKGHLNHGRLSAESIRTITNIPGFQKTFEAQRSTYREITDDPTDMFSYLFCNLRIDGEFYGRIIVDERVRPISRADHWIVDELRDLVEQAIKRNQLSEKSGLSHFCQLMATILRGERIESDRLERALGDLGWSGQERFFCVCVPLPKMPFSASASICELVESKLDDCQAFSHGSEVLVVVNAKKWEERMPVFRLELRHIMDRLNLRAGISLPFHDLTQLGMYCEQASMAIRFSLEHAPDCRTACFEEHTLDYLLDHSISAFSARMLCPPALLDLIEYDKENGTDYVQTLRVYLECNSSPSQAMEKLYLHRSTLLYRLNRIQELIRTDVADPRVKLHFLLAFQLLDLDERRKVVTQ